MMLYFLTEGIAIKPENYLIINTGGGKGGGGGGTGLNKFLHLEAPLRGSTPYPFIHHFLQKRYPFRIPSIDKWYPFHVPCLELCIPFNCCKCTVF